MRLLPFPTHPETPSCRPRLLLRVFLALLALCVFPVQWLRAFEVDPAKSEIVVEANAEDEVRFAAEELQKHLKLITGTEIPIVDEDQAAKGLYPFYVGIVYPGDDAPLKPEEARRHIGKDATYLYGYNQDHSRRRGADFAVYAFLEEELGVRWIEPGDAGIAYEEQSPLQLKEGESSWVPELLLRKIRTSWRPGKYGTLKGRDYIRDFADYRMTHEEHDALAEDVAVWQKRMRMGGHNTPQYGHAFTTWWKKYGETHPEYFAMLKNGKREPKGIKGLPRAMYTEANPRGFQEVKMCAASPALVEQIIQNWLDDGGPARTKWINTCENDGNHGYCVGEECLKLDVPLPGEKPLAHLTDRYVYLTNAVARAARKIDPEAGATMYAYSRYMDPPRREKVEPNVAIAFVPTSTDLDELDKFYGAWEAAGAKLLMLRPNYHTYYETMVIPAGFAEHMYKVFQVAYKHGARAADYDSLMGMWPITGLTDYVLAHTFSQPKKPFEYWLDQYCSAFGAASGDIKRYFDYWRNEVWNKRLLPNLSKIAGADAHSCNFARNLMPVLDEYYNPEDFDATDAILQEAAAQKLTDSQRQKVNTLILANKNARLTYNAAVTEGQEQVANAKKLIAFRKAHSAEMKDMNWIGAYAQEIRYFGDVTAVKKTAAFRDYDFPWLPTARIWQFKMDPENVGEKEKWQLQSWDQIADGWSRNRSDSNWENVASSGIDPELATKLKKYDGVGWYATRIPLPEEMKGRQVFLYFEGLDDSFTVYVNGERAGDKVYDGTEKDGLFTKEFAIEIGPQLDWNKKYQEIVVRVDDKGGRGGILERPWILSKKVPEKVSNHTES